VITPAPKRKLVIGVARRGKKVYIYLWSTDQTKKSYERIILMKLIEAMRKKAEQYDGINDMPTLKKLMKKLGTKDNKVRTVSIDFGRAYVHTYDTPSKINYNDYGDSPMVAKGYWKKGKLIPFSEKLIVKYQRSGEGSDR
jgi:hypothetical protein